MERTAAVSYHFFAHYRAPVLRALARSERCEFLFFADVDDPMDAAVASLETGDLPNFHRLPCRRIVGPFLWQPGVVRVAWRSDVHAVIFLGNMYMLWTWLAAPIARMRGKRVLFWTHGWLDPERGLKGWLRVLFYRLAHGLLVYEHKAKDLAIARRFRARDVYVVYNSLDPSAQRSAESGLADDEIERFGRELFGNDDPVVVCVSRLTENKRVEDLVGAARLLADAGMPRNLLIVGDGPARARLEALARESTVTAYFAGARYDETFLAKCFRLACVTVSPGPVGLLAIHSFGYGRPVIASDDRRGQKPESGAIVPGRNGDFFAARDVVSLSEAIARWSGSRRVDPEVERACREVVGGAYNPRYQRAVIEQAIEGVPADDLLRVRERAARSKGSTDRIADAR